MGIYLETYPARPLPDYRGSIWVSEHKGVLGAMLTFNKRLAVLAVRTICGDAKATQVLSELEDCDLSVARKKLQGMNHQTICDSSQIVSAVEDLTGVNFYIDNGDRCYFLPDSNGHPNFTQEKNRLVQKACSVAMSRTTHKPED